MQRFLTEKIWFFERCKSVVNCSTNCLIFFVLLQDHPGLRGTPLAMLAAQCNKLTTKSPPPLADAAVGKGFHPWKKSPQSSSSPSGGQNNLTNNPAVTPNNPQSQNNQNPNNGQQSNPASQQNQQQQQQRSSSNTSSQSYR